MTDAGFLDIAPDIFRQRLLVEGYFTHTVDAEAVGRFLLDAARALDLRTYGDPVVFSPESGMGRDENAGFDGFIPLIDSGISIYVWTGPAFVSVVFYTCKGFDAARAVAFTRDFFGIAGDIATREF